MTVSTIYALNIPLPKYSLYLYYFQVYRCEVYESITSQYCGWDHGAGLPRNIKFGVPKPIEPQDCRISNMTGMLKLNGKEYKTTLGSTVSHSTWLVGGLTTPNSECSVGNYDLEGGITLGKQAVQATYQVTVRLENAKVNDLLGTIRFDSGLRAQLSDGSLVDSLAGTYVWEHQPLACPQSLVSLYKGPVKVFVFI